MEFVKKHLTKILCAAILVSTFFPFVGFYAQAVESGEAYGDKMFVASTNLASHLFGKSGFFVTLVPICALAALILECINKYKATPVFCVVGIISLLIAPSSIHDHFINLIKDNGHYLGNDMMLDDNGFLCELIIQRSAGFVIMLLLYILLLIISILRFLNSSTKGSESTTDANTDGGEGGNGSSE